MWRSAGIDNNKPLGAERVKTIAIRSNQGICSNNLSLGMAFHVVVECVKIIEVFGSCRVFNLYLRALDSGQKIFFYFFFIRDIFVPTEYLLAE